MSQDTVTVVGRSRIERKILLSEASHAGWVASLEFDEQRYFGANPIEAVETLCRMRTGVSGGVRWDIVQELQDQVVKREIEET